MKTTIWKQKKVVVYVGGDPSKGQTPEITIELDNPQIRFDSESNIVIVAETK